MCVNGFLIQLFYVVYRKTTSFLWGKCRGAGLSPIQADRILTGKNSVFEYHKGLLSCDMSDNCQLLNKLKPLQISSKQQVL
jgi:hypothetical protein